MSKRKLHQSKTFGVAILNFAILKFFPGAKEWVAHNPEAYAEFLTITIITLRAISSGEVHWKPWEK